MASISLLLIRVLERISSHLCEGIIQPESQSNQPATKSTRLDIHCIFMINLPAKFSSERLLELLQDFTQKVLKAQRDESIPIVVILFENVCHAFQRYAALYKKVEAHDTLVALVVGAEEQFDKLRTEAVPECDESVCELLEGNVSAAVDVEAVE